MGELEMRARAIKALLMKAGKEEGEAETLAIEEALDEQKQKEKDVGNYVQPEEKKERYLREKNGSSDEEEEGKEDDGEVKIRADDIQPSEEEKDKQPEKVYNSENKAMNKAREALILSENKKKIEDEVRLRKDDEAKFMYEEQLRKEQSEKDRDEKKRMLEDAREAKRKLIESEQEERRKKIETEREKMKKDHE